MVLLRALLRGSSLLLLCSLASTANVTVTPGSWPSEISWDLTCSDGTSLLAGAPFNGDVSPAFGSSCNISLVDSYGDGWNGGSWEGFGLTLSVAAAIYQHTFFVTAPSPLPPPPPPHAPFQLGVPSMFGFEPGSSTQGWSTGASGYSWTLLSGPTPSGNTGPLGAHSGSHYVRS